MIICDIYCNQGKLGGVDWYCYKG